MKKKFIVLIVATVIISMGFGLVATISVSQAAPEPWQRKIVIFKSGVLNEPARDALIAKFGGVKIKDLTLINGKAVLLPPKAEALLGKQAGVLRIDNDVEVFTLSRAKIQPSEILPWGINRIDAELVWGTTIGNLVKVAIIDTGIDVKHPDLQANLKGGVSAVSYTTSYNDDNGHGTHVAGIVAAVDNEIGVIGVGPQINLYAVKVLDRRGSGYLSDVIEGLDWAIQNEMQVVNMSLGTSSDILSLREAVQRVNQAGIVQVAAAGNSGGAVIYPAAYPEVIAVSATDSADTIASWSSRGPEIDLAAPGVSIFSTYKGQTYKILSGTSMAAPHVTGAAALVLTVPEKCDLDLSGSCSPTEVQQRLEATAKPLGVEGKDSLYGSGLANAYNAVQQ